MFCVFYATYPLNTANLNVMKSTGNGNIFLKNELFKKIYEIVILIATVNMGVKYIALGLVLCGIINCYVASYPSRKIINCTFYEEFKMILPNLLVALSMGAVVYAVGLLNILPIVKLILQVATGGILYIVFSFVSKNKAFNEILGMVLSTVKKK